jgi:hypothetical protein
MLTLQRNPMHVVTSKWSKTEDIPRLRRSKAASHLVA